MKILDIAALIRKLTYRELVQFCDAVRGSGYEGKDDYRKHVLQWADGVIEPAAPPAPDHGICLPLAPRVEDHPIADEQRIAGGAQ